MITSNFLNSCICKAVLLVWISLVLIKAVAAYNIDLSQQDISWIGERIFANECSSRDELLVQWNKGEDFLSLGIGHFIWYPEKVQGPFQEVFPDFLVFAENAGTRMPEWLARDISQPCPWQNRQEFLNQGQDERKTTLQAFLSQTKALQAEFIIERFKQALDLMLQAIDDIEEQNRIKGHVQKLASDINGVYALIDYSNFKGMGLSPTERYKNQGWGLLQVLSGMRDERVAPHAVKEFAESADRILTQRVENAPADRNEQRWLTGWRNRINTY
jgi:hypothetical protein